MKANLTLFYSSKVYLNILENMSIEDIDKITTMYIDQEEILVSSNFKEQVERFYTYTANYRKSIKNPADKNAKLIITYYDYNGYFHKLRVLYQKDMVKLDSKKVVNAIRRVLKEANDSQIVLSILDSYPFIFESQHNIIYHKLFKLKKALKNTTTPKESQLPIFNKLIKIINDNLMEDYDEETKTTSEVSYYHIRLIDEFLEVKKKLKTIPRNKIDIDVNKISTLSNDIILEDKPSKQKMKKKTKTSEDKYYTLSDYYMELGDRSWKR